VHLQTGRALEQQGPTKPTLFARGRNGARLKPPMAETPDVDRVIGPCEECAYWMPRAIGFGECQAIRHSRERVPRPRSAKVEVDDETAGHSGRLVTSADFGCVQWEAKI
jgi:hypothetical protein